jgi:hypothetical protein
MNKKRQAGIADALKLLAVGAVVSLITTTAPAYAADVDVCGLVSIAEVQDVLGAPPTGTPRTEGPARDENYSSATNTSCGYANEDLKVGMALMLLEFPSVDDAQAAMADAIKDNAPSPNDPTASVTEEQGIGDRSYWMTSSDGVGYISRKGPRLLVVGVAAETTIPPGVRPKLRMISQNALSQL